MDASVVTARRDGDRLVFEVRTMARGAWRPVRAVRADFRDERLEFCGDHPFYGEELMDHKRILIVDDNADIHRDFAKVLSFGSARQDGRLAALERDIFDVPAPAVAEGADLSLSFALSGEEALRLVRQELLARRPYTLAFVDMRMPPGWDGLETVEHLWEVQPDLEIAICSAYSDYSWHDVIRRLGRPGIRLLQKPFGTSEVLQVTHELCNRAQTHRSGRERTAYAPIRRGCE